MVYTHQHSEYAGSTMPGKHVFICVIVAQMTARAMLIATLAVLVALAGKAHASFDT